MIAIPSFFVVTIIVEVTVQDFQMKIPQAANDCMSDNAIFDTENTTTHIIVPYPANDLSDCVSEILKYIWRKKSSTVSINFYKGVEFLDGTLKISQYQTIFLFRENADVQKFLNEYWILGYSTSTVFIFVTKNCENLKILTVWWSRYKILNILGYCSSANILFLYDCFEASLLEWNLKNFTNPRSCFTNRTNFYGYPLKVYMFDRIPTAVPTKNVSKTISESKTYKSLLKVVPYAGTDGFMLAELSKRLNFTPLVSEPKERLAYGQIFENGSGFGLLGGIAMREADLGGNGIYVKDYRTDRLDFLAPYTGINICFIVPKAAAIPQWKLVFSCFTKLSWSSLIAVVLLLTFFWNGFEKLLPSERYGNFYPLQLLLSVSSRNTSVLHSKRLLILTCLFFNMTITSVFQGNLVISYTKTVFYKDLDSLEDIDESGLLVSTCMTDIFGPNVTGVRKSLESKRVKTMTERSINRVAYKRDCCALERKRDAEFSIESYFVSEEGTPLLHITAACDLNYPVAYAVVKGFPFATSFNKVLAGFVEGGFIDKWNEDITFSITVRNRMKRSNRINAVAANKVIGIREMQAAFYILSVGLFLSFCVFVAEVFVNKIFA